MRNVLDALSDNRRNILQHRSSANDSERVIDAADLQNVLSRINAREVVHAIEARHCLADDHERAVSLRGKEPDANSGKRDSHLGVDIESVDSSSQVRSAHRRDGY